MSPEGKMSNDGGRPFGMVRRTDFLIDLFFFDGDHLGKVTGAKMEAAVVEMVVGGGWGGGGGGLSQFGGLVGGGYIGVADGLGMSVGESGEDDKESVVMSGGGGACVGSRGVSSRDCCRLP